VIGAFEQGSASFAHALSFRVVVIITIVIISSINVYAVADSRLRNIEGIIIESI
jgi:hypothetical protein